MERDRDLVMSMRSSSAMSNSRAASALRNTTSGLGAAAGGVGSSYTSAFIDDPTSVITSSASNYIGNRSTYTSDPLTTSSLIGGVGRTSGLSSGLTGSCGLDKKSFSNDEWSEANWLNSLRVSTGLEPVPNPGMGSATLAGQLSYEAFTNGGYSRMVRSNSSHDLREFEAPRVMPSKSRARHQTLAYGVSASDLGVVPGTFPVRRGSDHDLYSRTGSGGPGQGGVGSRESDVYDVRGFESDMSAAIMNARVSLNVSLSATCFAHSSAFLKPNGGVSYFKMHYQNVVQRLIFLVSRYQLAHILLKVGFLTVLKNIHTASPLFVGQRD